MLYRMWIMPDVALFLLLFFCLLLFILYHAECLCHKEIKKNLINVTSTVDLLQVFLSNMKINYVFWMLQISCSTVGWMLDIILNQESLIISSAYGKKKKKLNVHCRSNLPHNVICKGEDALSLLSSVFDILLLKKDIANRSAFLIWISYNCAGWVGRALATSNANALYFLRLTRFSLLVAGILF